MRQKAYFFVVMLLSVIPARSGIAQTLPLSREEFDSASTKAKRDALSRIATQSLRLEAADAVALMKAGLLDADRDVRRAALNAVAGHAAGPHFLTAADPKSRHERVREASLSERALIATLRPHVLAALSDPDPEVRHTAVFALECMDFNPRDRKLTLSEQTIADFGALYARESEGYVRTEIVKGFALNQGDSPKLREVVLDALDDPDAWVRLYALMAAERLKLLAALPKAVKALSDADAQVRSSAANALAAYCASSDCLDALEQALATETDQLARYAIENAVTKVRERQ